MEGCTPKLLRGNVPSASDWMDAWAEVTENATLRSQGRVHEKRTPAPDGRSQHRLFGRAARVLNCYKPPD